MKQNPRRYQIYEEIFRGQWAALNHRAMKYFLRRGDRYKASICRARAAQPTFTVQGIATNLNEGARMNDQHRYCENCAHYRPTRDPCTRSGRGHCATNASPRACRSSSKAGASGCQGRIRQTAGQLIGGATRAKFTASPAIQSARTSGPIPDPYSGRLITRRLGTRHTGHLLDGREHKEFPTT